MTPNISGSTSSSSIPTSIFEPSSPGYFAITLAANGKLEELKNLYQSHPTAINSLHKVSATSEDFYTPLHYAFAKKQWSTAAYLIQQGVDWQTFSIKAGQRSAIAIKSINTNPNGLVLLLKGLLETNEPIQIEPILDLITSHHIAVERRQEVLGDKELRHVLCSRIPLDQALFLMASLLVGSYQWKGIQTDYAFAPENLDLLPFDATINCNQLIEYAAILTGWATQRRMIDLINQGVIAPSQEIHQEILDPRTTPARRRRLMMPTNQARAANFGLPSRSERRPFNVSQQAPGAVQRKILFLLENDGFVDHYALFFNGKNGPRVIHITQQTGSVVCEPAEEAFRQERAQNVTSGMPEWLNPQISLPTFLP